MTTGGDRSARPASGRARPSRRCQAPRLLRLRWALPDVPDVPDVPDAHDDHVKDREPPDGRLSKYDPAPAIPPRRERGGVMAWLLLALALLLVVMCGVFVAAEFSFVTVDRGQVDREAAAGDAGALGVQQALRALSTQLSGAQVGITVTNLGIGFLAEPAVSELLAEPLGALGLAEGAVRPTSLALALALLVSRVLPLQALHRRRQLAPFGRERRVEDQLL